MESKEEAQKRKKQEKNKRYYDKHRGELNEKGKEKRQCDCGLWIRKCHLPGHRRRALHAKEL